MKNKNSEMTIGSHFNELRSRAMICILFYIVIFVLCYFFSKEIYHFLLKPFIEVSQNNQNRKLIYTSPTEAFTTYLKLSFYSSLFFSFPVFFAELYLFLSPALYKNEKKNILLTIFFSSFLFLFGAIFCYFFILPMALKFFASFENLTSIQDSTLPILLETKISDYLNFTINLLFGFGIAFLSPILLLFLIKGGYVKVKDLRSKRRYWIVIIFILSAILTPPDILSQISLAILLIILFEIVILLGKYFNK
jgi:sec-independent protein translocase protein TatC